jgi:hypothetical protein
MTAATPRSLSDIETRTYLRCDRAKVGRASRNTYQAFECQDSFPVRGDLPLRAPVRAPLAPCLRSGKETRTGELLSSSKEGASFLSPKRLQFADIANGKPVPVIGPSFDGGYYLIGVRRAHAELFHAIDWSTAQVVAQTRQRVLGLGLEVLDLDAWYDVDDAHSLQRLVYELASSQTVNATEAYPAPVTRAFLEQKALADRLATRGVAMMPSPAGGSRSHSLRNLDAAKSSS